MTDHHGTANGYKNLGCRCERCRRAWSEYVGERQKNIRAEGLTVSVPPSFHRQFNAYAKARGESMRSLAIRAINELMEREAVSDD